MGYLCTPALISDACPKRGAGSSPTAKSLSRSFPPESAPLALRRMLLRSHNSIFHSISGIGCRGFYTEVLHCMVLPMSRPQKHPRTGVNYFREKVPTDLRSAFGRVEVSRTLGTKDPAEAKVRHAEERRKLALVWQSMRAKPEPLPHKIIMALAGKDYRHPVGIMEEGPGEPEVPQALLPQGERAYGSPEKLEQWYGPEADRLLQEAGLAADDHSRKRLIEELHRVQEQWAQFQHRRSQGDYRPDPAADRFPQISSANTGAVVKEKPTLTGIFTLWEREHLANGKSKKTAADFPHKLDSLREFVGHDDADRVTPGDVVASTDRLRYTDGSQPELSATSTL